jgi:sugar-phosphatase
MNRSKDQREKASTKSSTICVRGVLFDMDGVLISSTAADERTWLRWARYHGMEGSFSLRATHGRRSIDTLRLLRPDLDMASEVLRIEEFDAEDQRGVVSLPGAERLIRSLPADAWAVVTSASEAIMKRRLDAAGIAPPLHFISGDRVTHGKPNPEAYEQGARILGLSPSECLVVEDAPPGIEAGKAAGCPVLATLTSHGRDELAQADWIVPSLEQVSASLGQDARIAIHLDL